MPSSHFRGGRPVMVDVTDKTPTAREAEAVATVSLPAEALEALQAPSAKGDPIAVAELAGIMAAKRTADLIPLCHPLPLGAVEVTGERDGAEVTFRALCRTTASTGVEMEALTAAAVAALTLYDMLKSASKAIVISDVRLVSKSGGRSGTWRSE